MAQEQLFNFADGSNLTPGMTGTNQFTTFLTPGSGGMGNMSGAGTPGIVPPQGSNPGIGSGTSPYTPYSPSVNSQFYYGSTYDPNFTANLEQFLSSQIGMGVTPFNLQSLLPSSGGTTQAGQLSAPNNQVLQNLFSYLTTGNTNGMPGLDTLQSMSQTGNPIDKTPAWQAMVDAMQRQIGQGATNLKEQFNVGGGLVGSPYGTAMSDYFSQTSKDLNAQLLGAQSQALESAAGRQLTAGQDLAGMQTQLGQLFQGLDQASIDRLLQEFIRVSPQSNPLLNAQYGLATTFPPYLAKQSNLTGLGAVIGNLGNVVNTAQQIPDIFKNITNLFGSFCWISRALYGDKSPRVEVIRRTMVQWAARSKEGLEMLKWYMLNGPQMALLIKADKNIDKMFREFFDQIYELGVQHG